MLTRLKVNGFKNLVNVDIRFGPFTCIAGPNGVGKSNLFDAIRFLSALADDRSLIEAAKSVREGRTTDVRSLFHRVGDHYDERMTFEAEMIVPSEGEDDLGQKATASITFLRYSLELVYRGESSKLSHGGIELEKEELVHISKHEARKHLSFHHSKAWRESAVLGRRTSPFISTDGEKIQLHQDFGGTYKGGGRPSPRLAASLPRTLLSVANAAENRTALLARREMQSWRLLQLEPSALREPDEFTAPDRLGSNGAHLASTLNRLARGGIRIDPESERPDEQGVYAKVANRLATLIDDVREVQVDRDEKRELYTLRVSGRDGTSHPARALSDGTLRFLALAVIELDPLAQGVLCLEEPENGIHPARIPAMLSLLKEIATDPDEPVGPDNPLRQVIINTHSPSVVGQVTDADLIVAEVKETVESGRRFGRVSFACLPGTWRAKPDSDTTEEVQTIDKGTLLDYLNPIPVIPQQVNGSSKAGVPPKHPPKPRRVVDRLDLQILLPFNHDPK
jgi:predicted ATPase